MIRERLRGRLEAWLLRVWFDSPAAPAGRADRVLADLAAPIAIPLSWLVAAVAIRRRSRIERQVAGDGQVPVIVVGNLVAGGAGKTPLAAAIALGLREHGFQPALLAGGYRAAPNRNGAILVDEATDPVHAGDEAVLLARQTGLPVAAGKDRRAGLALLARSHPACDVVVSDDGLQHCGLPRRIELLVIDDRGLGNGRCLPAGPLREPADRIDLVDAVIIAAAQSAAQLQPEDASNCRPRRRFLSSLQPTRFRTLAGDRQWEPAEFGHRYSGERLAAVAGIARPQRFFDLLETLGLRPDRYPLPDHGRIDPAWLAALPGHWLLLTAKDAVKCDSFPQGLRERCVYLEVRAEPDPALVKWLASELRPATRPDATHCNG